MSSARKYINLSLLLLLLHNSTFASDSLPVFRPLSFNKNNAIKNKTVRFIYLVSSDRKVNEQYKSGIERAALSVQQFYKKQLNGLTFKINDPIVEVVKCDKPANYFYTNPCDKDPDNWGFYNAYNEVNKLVGAKYYDTTYMWVIYSDGPGNKGRGGSSVCVMPEDDLIGLIGKHTEQPEINRWYGGLAHELGHALGLKHPENTTLDYKAIMWCGLYGFYPDEAYFTDEDKKILRQSSFISQEN